MQHKDLEFHVHDGTERIIYRFDEACAYAVQRSLAGAPEVYIDVVIWSAAGARAWGGDDAVEQYKEDPEASVFERITIRADPTGRVP